MKLVKFMVLPWGNFLRLFWVFMWWVNVISHMVGIVAVYELYL